MRGMHEPDSTQTAGLLGLILDNGYAKVSFILSLAVNALATSLTADRTWCVVCVLTV